MQKKIIIALSLLAVILFGGRFLGIGGQQIDFNTQVKPILNNKMYFLSSTHSPPEPWSIACGNNSSVSAS